MTTDKIIFWNQGEFFSFLLANSLQKKINGEFYEILDIPDRQKPFYRNQKLVDFKKIWFFHDEISKPRKEIDIEFPEERDYDTLAGFILDTLTDIPKIGEHVDFQNMVFTVQTVENNRIGKVKIHKNM